MNYYSPVSSNIEWAWALNNQGIAEQTQDNASKALMCFQDALEIYEQAVPQDQFTAFIHRNIARVYYDQREPDNDEVSLNKVRQIYKNLRVKGEKLAELYRSFGDVYLAQGKIDEAIQAYDRAIEVGKSPLTVEDMVSSYETNLALRERLPSASGDYCNLAMLYRSLGQTEKYFKAMEKAFACNQQVESSVSLANSYSKLALTCYEIDLSKIQDVAISSRGYDHLRIAYRLLGRIDKYVKTRETAVHQSFGEQSMTNAKNCYLLGLAYLEQDNIYDAIVYVFLSITFAKNINPSSSEYKEFLGGMRQVRKKIRDKCEELTQKCLEPQKSRLEVALHNYLINRDWKSDVEVTGLSNDFLRVREELTKLSDLQSKLLQECKSAFPEELW